MFDPIFKYKKSFIKMLNNKGPSIDACGMPLMFIIHSEKESIVKPFVYLLLFVTSITSINVA